MTDAKERRGRDGVAKQAVGCAVYSPLLAEIGVPHGFSTRHGGVSTGVFNSLNFGNPGELPPVERDPKVNIRKNWELLTAAIAAEIPGSMHAQREIVEVHQVHGDVVVRVTSGAAMPRDAAGHDLKADALVTDDATRLIAVRVADCTPILLSSGDGRVVGAVHAGWRGVVGGVVMVAVREMAAVGGVGVNPVEMAAAIGPCIGATAFEVGPEVAAEFRRVFGAGTEHVRETGMGGVDGKHVVDLKGAIREQLIAAGLSAARIDVLPHCTVRDGADFFSHRREHGRTGRMVGVIGPR